MARPRTPQPVKLFVGLLSGDPDLLRRARQLLKRRLGPIESESDLWPFNHTDYYEPEMGPDLQRWFLSFEQLVDPGALATIKLETNALEAQIADQCLTPGHARPVNIDPGYVDLAKLVLATTKDRGHRIFIGHGIYAEVTLLFERDAWRALPWTYPDFGRSEYYPFFLGLRERLRQQRAAGGDGADKHAADHP